jgi:hypothetical protein
MKLVAQDGLRKELARLPYSYKVPSEAQVREIITLRNAAWEAILQA